MQLAIAIAFTAVYCGALWGAAYIGYRANLIVRAQRKTNALCRFVDRFAVQFVAMALSFGSCIGFAMADKPLAAALMVIPFALVMSCLIYLEDVPASDCAQCRLMGRSTART